MANDSKNGNAERLFNFWEPYSGYWVRAALRAVCIPLLAKRDLDDAGVRKQASIELYDLWHAKLAALQELPKLDARSLRLLAGIPRKPDLLTAERKLRMRRCPPVGVRVTANGFMPQHCQQAAICPFCWARAAGAAWARVDELLFPLIEQKRPERTAYDIIEHRRVIRLAAIVHDAFDTLLGSAFDVAIRARLGKLQATTVPIGSRAKELGRLQCVAAVEHMSFDFTEDRDVRDIRVNQLFVVQYNQPFMPRDSAGTHLQARYETPTRSAVADAVARVFAYPADLLEASAIDIEGYLQARFNKRLTEFTGAFRAARTPQPAADE
jgi:hypothetical protein